MALYVGIDSPLSDGGVIGGHYTYVLEDQGMGFGDKSGNSAWFKVGESADGGEKRLQDERRRIDREHGIPSRLVLVRESHFRTEAMAWAFEQLLLARLGHDGCQMRADKNDWCMGNRTRILAALKEFDAYAPMLLNIEQVAPLKPHY